MKYFVFDVESAGLNGEGFAVGYVVVDDETLSEVACGWKSAGIDSVPCNFDDLCWLVDNLPSGVLYPKEPMPIQALRDWFKAEFAKFEGAALVSDCGFPVEANWLRACQVQPYPLHEVATALLMAGKDPVGNYDRLPTELPKHHPLYDARQSGRLFLNLLLMAKGWREGRR